MGVSCVIGELLAESRHGQSSANLWSRQLGQGGANAVQRSLVDAAKGLDDQRLLQRVDFVDADRARAVERPLRRSAALMTKL